MRLAAATRRRVQGVGSVHAHREEMGSEARERGKEKRGMRIRVHSTADDGLDASMLPVALRMPFAREDGSAVPLYRAFGREYEQDGDLGDEMPGEPFMVFGDGSVDAATSNKKKQRQGPRYIGVDAIASSTAAEASGSHGEADDEAAARYVVCSATTEDDGSRTLHIWPLRTQRPINMVEAPEHVAPPPGRAAAGGASTEERYQVKEELVNAFGSRRSRANLEEAKRRKIQINEIDAGNSNALLSATKDAITIDQVKMAQQADRLRRLPLGDKLKDRLGAKTGAEAFPIDELVPPELFYVLNAEADELIKFARSRKARATPKLSKAMIAVALRIFGSEGVGGDGEEESGGEENERDAESLQRQKARALVLASYMISILVAPPKKLQADADMPIATIASQIKVKSTVVLVYLLDRYTETSIISAPSGDITETVAAADKGENVAPRQMFEYRRDAEKKDDLLMYVIALLLACEDYQCDLFDLSKEARRSLPQIMKLAKALGCDVLKPGTMVGGKPSKSTHPNPSTSTAVSLLADIKDGKTTLLEKLPEVNLRARTRR